MKTAYKLILALILIIIPVKVLAFSAESTFDQGFDETIADQTQTVYKSPTKVYIAQITTQTAELQRNPSLWVKTLYYYSITRLNFADLPYTYLIDSNGTIYEGRSSGVGAVPELKDNSGAILIGYLSNDPILTSRASTALYNLVDSLGYDWGIAEVSAVKLTISQTDGQLTKLVPETVKGDFNDSIKEVFSGWKGYSKEHLDYNLTVESVTYDPEVVIGSKLHVSVKIKNTGDFTWLTDRTPIYISIANDKDSSFAINGVWDSFSKPTHLGNKAVLPGEEVTLEFDLLAKQAPGKVSESFVLEKYEGKSFANSSFKVEFTITKGKYTLVEVSSPLYGFANIRECQWYSCKVIDSPENGTVYILLKEEDGWMKIQYDEDTVGWVYSKYMKKI